MKKKLSSLIRQCQYVLIQPVPPRCFFYFPWLFWSSQSKAALHKRLFWFNMTLGKQAIVQWIIYFRWIIYGALFVAARTSIRLSEQRLHELNLTRRQLFLDLLQQGYRYVLSSGDYFFFELYKKSRRQHIAQFVFHQHLPTFHHVSNQPFANWQASMRLISDKYQFSLALKKHNLPTVDTQCYTSREIQNNLAIVFKKSTIFCKPNHGSHSQHAFMVDYNDSTETYRIIPIHGSTIEKNSDITRYLNRVWQSDSLWVMQPLLEDHMALGTKQQNNACTTVRIVTGRQRPPDQPQLLYLQLEIPREKIPTSSSRPYQQLYSIFPLHWQTFEIDPVFQTKYPARCKHLPVIAPALKVLLQQSITDCIAAHQQLLDLCSVGFDVVLTPEGPVILEANYNWSVPSLYQVIEDEPLQSHHPASTWLRYHFDIRQHRSK